MILTGTEIIREVNSGRIVLSPFSEQNINPNSYNYHLGTHYVIVESSGPLDSCGKLPALESKMIPKDGIVIEPNRLYLCNTHEFIGSNCYVTSLIGKSSMGRLGLFLQVSANLGHQMQIHQWTLEIRSCIPIRIYPGMIIGQVTFWKTLGETLDKPGFYGTANAPTPSIGVRL